MSRNNPNNFVKFPMNFPAGLGYSPAAAGPVGGWSYTPGPGFFSRQPMDSLLPRLSGPGSTPRSSFGKRRFSKRRFSKRRFGYPLMNLPSQELNQSSFPRYPVGPGNSPGGVGGPFMQSGTVNFNTYWGFGNRRRSRKSRRSRRRSRRSRKSRRTRKSKI